MLIYSKEKAEIRQKLSVIADDLKSLGVRVQELNALSSPYDVVQRSFFLHVNHAIIRAMSAGYSEKDARDLVRQDLEVSAELMNWSDTYTERIKKGYVTYAQIYVSKRLKAKGFSTRQIADILEISPSTVLDRLKQEQK